MLNPQLHGRALAGLGGNLVVAVAAFDAAGCLLGHGDNYLFTAGLASDVSTGSLTVSLRQTEKPDCSGSRDLTLHDVDVRSNSSSDGGVGTYDGLSWGLAVWRASNG